MSTLVLSSTIMLNTIKHKASPQHLESAPILIWWLRLKFEAPLTLSFYVHLQDLINYYVYNHQSLHKASPQNPVFVQRNWPKLKSSSNWSIHWPMAYILCFINKGPMILSLFPQLMQYQLPWNSCSLSKHPRFMYANYLLWLCSQSTSRQSQNAKTFLQIHLSFS